MHNAAKAFFLPAIAIATSLGLSACETASPVTENYPVTVEVDYRERIILVPGHVLKVQVQDTSLADAPATTVAEKTLELEGRSPPYKLVVDVPATRINNRHTYSVRAEIFTPDGNLRFTTDTAHNVITSGAPLSAAITVVGTR